MWNEETVCQAVKICDTELKFEKFSRGEPDLSSFFRVLVNVQHSCDDASRVMAYALHGENWNHRAVVKREWQNIHSKLPELSLPTSVHEWGVLAGLSYDDGLKESKGCREVLRDLLLADLIEVTCNCTIPLIVEKASTVISNLLCNCPSFVDGDTILSIVDSATGWVAKGFQCAHAAVSASLWSMKNYREELPTAVVQLMKQTAAKGKVLTSVAPAARVVRSMFQSMPPAVGVACHAALKYLERVVSEANVPQENILIDVHEICRVIFDGATLEIALSESATSTFVFTILAFARKCIESSNCELYHVLDDPKCHPTLAARASYSLRRLIVLQWKDDELSQRRKFVQEYWIADGSLVNSLTVVDLVFLDELCMHGITPLVALEEFLTHRDGYLHDGVATASMIIFDKYGSTSDILTPICRKLLSAMCETLRVSSTEAFLQLGENYANALADEKLRLQAPAGPEGTSSILASVKSLMSAPQAGKSIADFPVTECRIEDGDRELTTKIEQIGNNAANGTEFWLHATTLSGALTIRRGIEPSRGTSNRDFGLSGSFYLHPYRQSRLAITMAVRKLCLVPNDTPPPQLAIVIFQIPPKSRASFEPNIVLEACPVWTALVQASRDQETSRRDPRLTVSGHHADTVQWLEGPILASCQTWEPLPLEPHGPCGETLAMQLAYVLERSRGLCPRGTTEVGLLDVGVSVIAAGGAGQ